MATRYWVGGTGTWDATTTTRWSDTSGGAGGASAPTSADNVIFDANSGTGTVTIGLGAVCLTVTGNNNLTFSFTISNNSTYLTVGSQKVTVLTQRTSFVTPEDWNDNSNAIYLIGGGGGGGGCSYNGVNRAAGGGGGGGGFRLLTNQTISGLVPYQIGAGGMFGTGSSLGAFREGGTGGTTTWNTIYTATGGTGGGAQGNIPTVSSAGVGGTGTFTGGTGGLGGVNNTNFGTGGGGGGGSAGPNGNGGNGGTGVNESSTIENTGGGGGGNGGGTAGGNGTIEPSVSGVGGNNSLGLGGGASRTTDGTGNTGTAGGGGSGGLGGSRSGGNGGNGVDILGIVGSGGGAGGSTNVVSTTSNAGLYGGGGTGNGTPEGTSAINNGRGGAQGAIIIVYTPVPNPNLYSVGNSEVANYVNTSTGKVADVVALNGVGGLYESVNVTKRSQLSFIIASNIPFASIDITTLTGYVPGQTDITIRVNQDVYVYGVQPVRESTAGFIQGAPDTASSTPAAMTIIGGYLGDTIRLVNNGYIVGYGGNAGGAYSTTDDCCGGWSFNYTSSPSIGGTALSFVTPGINIDIENNGYIAGGGGGGGYGGTVYNTCQQHAVSGGGGAGGGVGGPSPNNFFGYLPRAVPPNSGSDGSIISVQSGEGLVYNGGGGGFVFPGVGGDLGSAVGVGIGGGAGGSGAVYTGVTPYVWNNNGGSGSNNAPTPTSNAGNQAIGGGGGGWGASGANGYNSTSINDTGQAGGNSIITNGNAYTMLGDGATRLYGPVDTAIRTSVYTFTTSSLTSTSLDINTIPGYVVGNSVVLLVPAGVILSSSSAATPALILTLTGNLPFCRIIVNGYIIGAGGQGGSSGSSNGIGGDAIRLPVFSTSTTPWIIDTSYGYVAAGGGGGGRSNSADNLYRVNGGGGAGFNGSSGGVGDIAYNPGVNTIGTVGNNGTVVTVSGINYASGGSGGTILPPSSTFNSGTFAPGIYPGLGGIAGGPGAFVNTVTTISPNNFGGGTGNGGSTVTTVSTLAGGGGGGGFGGNGGTGRRGSTSIQTGQFGGAAIRFSSFYAGIIYITNQNNLYGRIRITS